ncbi:putative lipopolysaccharide heptosyltransferase III [Mangrovitalea sediminis]|uniref:putative lipopolysaccharide heptosyltransferase III n=1 Tax=Mangrovitalea sediminis TaxID=1982043 RepID=UPI000BE5D99B|nr:putative lipopolysaccharide heptosyltransferase III [Mangrovitalea sediminis]
MINYLKDAVDFSQISRVLIIKLRHHGDVLLTSHLFRVLKHQYPHLEVDGLVYKDTGEMLSLHPDMAQLHLIDRNWKKLGLREQLRAEVGLIRQLKQRRYDLVIHLTEHWRGLLLTRLIGPRFAVAGSYASRQSKWWRKTFTHQYPIVPRRHMVEVHLDALRRIGLHSPAETRKLVIATSPETDAEVAQLLTANGTAPGRYIHLHPTSRWLFKSWDPAKFSQLIRQLLVRGHHVVVTAAPDGAELAMVEEILRDLPQQPINLAGKLSLKQLVAVTRNARCFMGMDSVPMHIAAAVDTPSVALFGPSGETEWGPWNEKAEVLTEPFSCRPCGKDGCGSGKVSECLWQIPVERVLDAIERACASGASA